MLTNLFKNNVLSYVIVLMMSVLLWGVAYFSFTLDYGQEVNIGEFSFHISKQHSIIISFVIAMIAGFFLNYRIKKYLLSYEPNNLFLFLYVLLISTQLLSPNLLVFSLVSFFLAFFVNYLLFFIEDKTHEKQVFNSAILLGILIFHNPILGILIFILIQNLSAIRRVTLKEVILILVGFLIPMGYVFMISSLVDNPNNSLTDININYEFPKINWKYGVVFLLFIFLSINGFQMANSKRSGTDINTLRLTKNLFAFLIASILVAFISLFIFPQGYAMFVIAVPLSIFLSFYFSNSSFKWKELLFLICIGATFLLR
ncbi:MAG: hypothetical protein ACPGVD_04625 [Flavobacteriales bacterium]